MFVCFTFVSSVLNFNSLYQLIFILQILFFFFLKKQATFNEEVNLLPELVFPDQYIKIYQQCDNSMLVVFS
jgi:hypothetical protein